MWRESGKQQADLARPGGQVSHPCPMAVPGMCAGDLEIEIPRGECSARRASSGSPTGCVESSQRRPRYPMLAIKRTD